MRCYTTLSFFHFRAAFMDRKAGACASSMAPRSTACVLRCCRWYEPSLVEEKTTATSARWWVGERAVRQRMKMKSNHFWRSSEEDMG